MSWFNRGISKPVPVQSGLNDGQRVQWNGTNIQVAYSAQYAQGQGGANYVTTVHQHLTDIDSFPLGQQFLAAIQATGKNVIVVYGGANNNQAAGSAMGYCVLRKWHDGADRAQFGLELNRMITASGKSKQQVATELYQKMIPTWGAGTIPSPFRAVPVNVGLPSPIQPPRPLPPLPGARPLPPIPGSLPKPVKALPMSPADAIVAKLDAWIAGTATLPTNDEIDAILLVLEQWIQRGVGVGTRINYDPHKTVANGQPRPPQVALFHELMHAYYNALGAQLGREDSMNEANGGRLFELMAVGLAPFQARQFSENQMRTVLGVALRPTYP